MTPETAPEVSASLRPIRYQVRPDCTCLEVSHIHEFLQTSKGARHAALSPLLDRFNKEKGVTISDRNLFDLYEGKRPALAQDTFFSHILAFCEEMKARLVLWTKLDDKPLDLPLREQPSSNRFDLLAQGKNAEVRLVTLVILVRRYIETIMQQASKELFQASTVPNAPSDTVTKEHALDVIQKGDVELMVASMEAQSYSWRENFFSRLTTLAREAHPEVFTQRTILENWKQIIGQDFQCVYGLVQKYLSGNGRQPQIRVFLQRCKEMLQDLQPIDMEKAVSDMHSALSAAGTKTDISVWLSYPIPVVADFCQDHLSVTETIAVMHAMEERLGEKWNTADLEKAGLSVRATENVRKTGRAGPETWMKLLSFYFLHLK